MNQIVCDYCKVVCSMDYFEVRRWIEHQTLEDDTEDRHFCCPEHVILWMKENK